MKKSIRKVLSLILAMCMILSLVQTAVFAFEMPGEEKPRNAANVMTKETYVAADGTKLPYRLYVPEDYSPDKQYSFLLFLHGAGNRGNDNESQVSVNTGLLDRIIGGEKLKNGEKEIDSSKEFIMIAPQCASGKQWVDTSWSVTPDPSYKLDEIPQSQYMTAVVELIDKMKADYTLNPSRMYVTGLSMGGFGTWDLIMRYPNLFAAAIPMGGAGDTSKADVIANTPVWTFHQLQDPTVAADGTVAMVKALSEVGAEVKFTPYFDGVHNAWTKGYAEPDMLKWLYSHTKERIKIAFVGDSITYGAGVSDRATKSFAGIIAKATSDKYHAINFGVSATSALYSAKTPYFQTEAYASALEFNPDILHIMLGTNDIKNENWDLGKGNFKLDYKKIVDSFKAINPNLKIVVGIPPRIHKENVFGERNPQILEEEGIPLIYEVAEEINATVANYFDPTKDKPEYFPDFLHPNDEGHKIMADIALAAIEEVEKTLPEKEAVEAKIITNGASDWAKGEIALSYAASIMPEALSAGYQENITRQEFCQLVVNMIPKDLTGDRSASFKDCKDEAVNRAYSLGVVNGVSEKAFEPDKPATRQEMAAMIFRAYKLVAPKAKPQAFGKAPDRNTVDTWAIEATDFLSENEIMKGDENGYLKPFDNTSREEAVLLVYRAFCSANRYGK